MRCHGCDTSEDMGSSDGLFEETVLPASHRRTNVALSHLGCVVFEDGVLGVCRVSFLVFRINIDSSTRGGRVAREVGLAREPVIIHTTMQSNGQVKIDGEKKHRRSSETKRASRREPHYSETRA